MHQYHQKFIRILNPRLDQHGLGLLSVGIIIPKDVDQELLEEFYVILVLVVELGEVRLGASLTHVRLLGHLLRLIYWPDTGLKFYKDNQGGI